ncbi:MAG: hypothetical protein PHI36_02010, partial [Bacteroidales bacterium]|nr:hypothetical protein [Bacteroidales bacterium]
NNVLGAENVQAYDCKGNLLIENNNNKLVVTPKPIFIKNYAKKIASTLGLKTKKSYTLYLQN